MFSGYSPLEFCVHIIDFEYRKMPSLKPPSHLLGFLLLTLEERIHAGLSVVQIDHQCHLVAISSKVTGHKGSIRYKFDFVRTN